MSETNRNVNAIGVDIATRDDRAVHIFHLFGKRVFDIDLSEGVQAGRYRAFPGVYFTLTPNEEVGSKPSFKVRFDVKWYGYPFLSWNFLKFVHNPPKKHYLLLFAAVVIHTVSYWMRMLFKRGSLNGRENEEIGSSENAG